MHLVLRSLRRWSFVIPLLVAAATQVAHADDLDAAWQAAGRGAVVLMRHATAPGTGDPANFKLGECTTQRNLDATGRAEAAAIGAAFRAHGIRVDRVLSSQWCRTHDTANLAFPGQVVDEPIFNSFYENAANNPKQTAAAQVLLSRWKGPGALVVVTHQVNITALTGVVPGLGEAVVVVVDGGRLKVVGRIPVAR